MIYRARRPDLHQEEDVVPKWAILCILGGLLAISAILVAWAGYAEKAEEAKIRPTGDFPEAHLEPQRDSELLERLFDEVGAGQILNAEQRRSLHAFGWVDPATGIVSIPIDDAMNLVIEENRR